MTERVSRSSSRSRLCSKSLNSKHLAAQIAPLSHPPNAGMGPFRAGYGTVQSIRGTL